MSVDFSKIGRTNSGGEWQLVSKANFPVQEIGGYWQFVEAKVDVEKIPLSWTEPLTQEQRWSTKTFYNQITCPSERYVMQTRWSHNIKEVRIIDILQGTCVCLLLSISAKPLKLAKPPVQSMLKAATLQVVELYEEDIREIDFTQDNKLKLNDVEISLEELSALDPNTDWGLKECWWEEREDNGKIVIVKRERTPTPYNPSKFIEPPRKNVAKSKPTNTTSKTSILATTPPKDAEPNTSNLKEPELQIETIVIGNVSVEVQVGGTCSFYATSAVIKSAIDRVYARESPNPTRDELLAEALQLQDLSREKRFDELCPKYRLAWKKITLKEAIDAVLQKRHVYFSFGLPAGKYWSCFSFNCGKGFTLGKDFSFTEKNMKHFKDGKRGRHGVVLEAFYPYKTDDGRICGELLCQNSWGTAWGKNGYFKIYIDDADDQNSWFYKIMQPVFISVHWTKVDLTRGEREAYEKFIQSQTRSAANSTHAEEDSNDSDSEDQGKDKEKPKKVKKVKQESRTAGFRCTACSKYSGVPLVTFKPTKQGCREHELCTICVGVQNKAHFPKCLGCLVCLHQTDTFTAFFREGYCYSCVLSQQLRTGAQAHSDWPVTSSRACKKMKSWNEIPASEIFIPVSKIPFVGEKSVALLNSNGIHTVADLFYYLGIEDEQPLPSEGAYHFKLKLLRGYLPPKVDAGAIMNRLCEKAFRAIVKDALSNM